MSGVRGLVLNVHIKYIRCDAMHMIHTNRPQSNDLWSSGDLPLTLLVTTITFNVYTPHTEAVLHNEYFIIMCYAYSAAIVAMPHVCLLQGPP